MLSTAISIHALLAESDTTKHLAHGVKVISIHALLAESDCFGRITSVSSGLFLSTLSLRRATCDISAVRSRIRHFYPRSPCGERPCGRSYDRSRSQFLSTLSLRRATLYGGCTMPSVAFLSTLSLRRATACDITNGQAIGNFYPRSPCGERRVDIFRITPDNYFYPRSPCGERHACLIIIKQHIHFYPRSPCGERRLVT